jgi:hypothetical protein
MQPWLKPDEVRAHLPKGCELPSRFDEFVRAEPECRVEWNDLDSYPLKPSATKEAVPFLRLSDGALVALWYHRPSPAVVLIGGHGELKVVAASFDDFLKALAVQRSGVPDFDSEERLPFVVPGTKGKPNTAGLAELQELFQQWFKKHTSLLPPLRTPETELLRQRIYAIAEVMSRDGRPKPFTYGATTLWSHHYRVERKESGLAISYLDYGKWYPVPEEYKLTDKVSSLLELVQDKNRDQYEFVVHCKGLVSVDRDRQLLLLPPEPNIETTADHV